MARLDELIKTLCPDGVPYKRLDECCTLEKGKTPIQKAVPGEYPLVVTTAERKTANTYQFEKPTVCVPLVSSRGHGVACLNAVYYQEGKFALGNILCGVTPLEDSGLTAKFLFYYLNLKKDTLIVPLMKGGANVSLTVNSLKTVKMPIPPLEVQTEVIGLIDKFEELISTLKKELTARKQQYEYYKNYLFETADTTNRTTTKDVTKDRFWLMPATPKYISDGVPYITSKNVRNGRIGFADVKYISEEDYLTISKNRSVEKDDLLITMIGTIGEAAFVGDFTHFYGQNIYLIRFDESVCLRKYFYYFLSSEKVKNSLISKKNASSQGYIKAGSIDNLEFPLPSIAEQQQIVDILDKFDYLCENISAGLPAEIEARQKQYEYYRDKLLSFQELKG